MVGSTPWSSGLGVKGSHTWSETWSQTRLGVRLVEIRRRGLSLDRYVRYWYLVSVSFKRSVSRDTKGPRPKSDHRTRVPLVSSSSTWSLCLETSYSVTP